MELQEYMNLIYMAGHNPRRYDMREFVLGMDRENEHAEELNLSKEDIARLVLRHLKEDPTYYTKLNAVIPVIEDGQDESEDLEEEEEEIPDENEHSLIDPTKIKVKKKLPMQKEEWV